MLLSDIFQQLHVAALVLRFQVFEHQLSQSVERLVREFLFHYLVQRDYLFGAGHWLDRRGILRLVLVLGSCFTSKAGHVFLEHHWVDCEVEREDSLWVLTEVPQILRRLFGWRIPRGLSV